MKLPDIKILDEKNKLLHQISKDVKFPLTKEDHQRIQDMLTYLEMSQNEKYAEKYNLRPGMGLAYIQIGIPKRIFVICNELENHTFEKHVVINPKILSESEEMIYVGEGEGCLSVNRDVDGIVLRHARVKVEAYNEYGEKYQIRVREDIAIAFQHEIDHLNGILFPDKIDPKNPYKGSDSAREI